VDTNGIISTVAGDSSSAYGADGVAATNSSLRYPACVAFDASGNFYIADIFSSRIRKVDTNGIISTVAGSGEAGYGQDGVSATSMFATLYYPQGVAFDALGNLYIADTHNNRIRQVDTNGIIHTVAGNGVTSYAGDGGLATNASLASPWGVAFDSAGNMYIADQANNRVRMVDTNGVISTVAGNGKGTFAGDGGAATNASLESPACVALDAAGNLYIADWYNNRIREVNFAGSPTIALINVNVTNAGDYSVIITSPSGSVTSSVVALTLQLPPITPSFTASNGTFNFTWSAVSNLTYQLQYTLALSSTDWINLGNPITATSNSVSTEDIPGSDRQRFYRVQLLP
jgi:sugar lactone lactonase YvrE